MCGGGLVVNVLISYHEVVSSNPTTDMHQCHVVLKHTVVNLRV